MTIRSINAGKLGSCGMLVFSDRFVLLPECELMGNMPLFIPVRPQYLSNSGTVFTRGLGREGGGVRGGLTVLRPEKTCTLPLVPLPHCDEHRGTSILITAPPPPPT